MRRPAARAPRPARTQLHRSIRAAHLPRPRPPPAPQHGTAARRAPQLTRRQPALDSIKIGLYGDHCASKREQTALPGQRVGSLRSPIAIAEPAALAATSRPSATTATTLKVAKCQTERFQNVAADSVLWSRTLGFDCSCVFLCAVGK